MSSNNLQIQDLFNVAGVVAVVTGGGSGMCFVSLEPWIKKLIRLNFGLILCFKQASDS